MVSCLLPFLVLPFTSGSRSCLKISKDVLEGVRPATRTPQRAPRQAVTPERSSAFKDDRLAVTPRRIPTEAGGDGFKVNRRAVTPQRNPTGAVSGAFEVDRRAVTPKRNLTGAGSVTFEVERQPVTPKRNPTGAGSVNREAVTPKRNPMGSGSGAFEVDRRAVTPKRKPTDAGSVAFEVERRPLTPKRNPTGAGSVNRRAVTPKRNPQGAGSDAFDVNSRAVTPDRRSGVDRRAVTPERRPIVARGDAFEVNRSANINTLVSNLQAEGGCKRGKPRKRSGIIMDGFTVINKNTEVVVCEYTDANLQRMGVPIPTQSHLKSTVLHPVFILVRRSDAAKLQEYEVSTFQKYWSQSDHWTDIWRTQQGRLFVKQFFLRQSKSAAKDAAKEFGEGLATEICGTAIGLPGAATTYKVLHATKKARTAIKNSPKLLDMKRVLNKAKAGDKVARTDAATDLGMKLVDLVSAVASAAELQDLVTELDGIVDAEVDSLEDGSALEEIEIEDPSGSGPDAFIVNMHRYEHDVGHALHVDGGEFSGGKALFPVSRTVETYLSPDHFEFLEGAEM